MVNVSPGLNVRSVPSSEVVFQNELGVVGRLLECVPDYCRILVEGEKGWLPKAAIWGVDAAELYP